MTEPPRRSPAACPPPSGGGFFVFWDLKCALLRKRALFDIVDGGMRANGKVILLTDSVDVDFMGWRYMAPYVLATQLEGAGFEVVVIDYFTKIPDFFSYLEQFLDDRVLFVGISTTFLSQEVGDKKLEWLKSNQASRQEFHMIYSSPGLWLGSAEKLDAWLGRLKSLLHKYNSRADLVMGGAKAWYALTGNCEFGHIDYLALSASDQSIVEFAKNRAGGRPPKVFTQSNRKIIDNREFLKEKVCPETIWTERYAVSPGEALPIEISRGCVFNCKFCHYDKRESARKDLRVLREEFIRNYERFGTTVYSFCDDCFNDSRRKVEETCNVILGLPFHIEWISYARVDVAVRFPHTLDLMVESGARGLFWGLESFHPEAARKAGKGTPPDRVKEFLLTSRKKHKHKCLFEGSFVVGLPGETPESQRDTIRWMVENDAVDFTYLGPLQLAKYEEKLDKIQLDFADYSRDPGRYGFHYVEFNPQRWGHDTMNSDEANDLAKEFIHAWEHSRGRNMVYRVWQYPALRTLGLTFEQIREIARGGGSEQNLHARRADFYKNYWKLLAEKCGRGQLATDG